MFKKRIEHKENFYKTIEQWWVDNDFPNIGFSAMPENIFIVSKDDVDLYAVPLYITDSSICIIGFPTGNKTADKEIKVGALDFIIEEIKKDIKEIGYDTILTASMNPKLMDLFVRCGFSVTDEGTTPYILNV